MSIEEILFITLYGIILPRFPAHRKLVFRRIHILQRYSDTAWETHRTKTLKSEMPIYTESGQMLNTRFQKNPPVYRGILVPKIFRHYPILKLNPGVHKNRYNIRHWKSQK